MLTFENIPVSTFWAARVAHGGVLTGHWEFDLALFLVLMAVVAYSFLLPADALFFGALALAALGLRNL